MQGLRFIVSLSLVIGVAGGGMARAQEPSPPATPKLLYSDYDVATNGPLLAVLEGGMGSLDLSRLPPEQRKMIAAWMDSRVKRVVVGSVTVVAPKTMQIIEANPGKPDPYAGLAAEERVQVLLSFFDAAQWAQAGSVQGIGLADLNDVQGALFVSLLPEKMTVQRTRLVAGEKPVEIRYEAQGAPQNIDPLTARLRLVRKVNFTFSKERTEDYGYGGQVEPAVGDEIVTLTTRDQARGDKKSESETLSAFGVPIVRMVPSRLKPGDLDFTEPKLHLSIALDGDLKTLGDLLKRIAKATGMDLMADKRVAARPILVRALSGQQARGGDLLQALCWAVTGTFRRVGTSTYLLTDDVAGIGARFARLAEWAEAADEARRDAMDRAKDVTVKHDPLSHIGFAPGDTHGLPPDMMRRIDDAYRKERYQEAPEVKFADLPASLQQTVTQLVDFWSKNGTPVRMDRMRVGTELSVQFLLPGGAALTPSFSQNIGSEYLRAIAAGPTAPAPPVRTRQSVPPRPMSEAVRKRVLLARMPADDPAVAALLGVAKAKGFTEVWLHVRLDAPQTVERLMVAQVVGRKLGLFLGCAVSLLRGGGMPGAEDINVLGETGAAFAKRKVAAQPQYRTIYTPFADWTLLSSEQATRLLTPLAQVPGLSALTLKASAAPGWAGETPGGDGIPTNGHLGFDTATRLACLRAEGFDPIDVGPYDYALKTPPSLHFFPDAGSSGLHKTLNDFRFEQNRKSLAQVRAALRKLAPQLPVYLDDRASPYTDTEVRWFGRWDDTDRMAVNPISSVESEAREVAFAASPEPLLRCPGWDGKPEGLAKVLGETAAKAVKKWPGIALDLTGFAPVEALEQLGGLPDIAVRPH
jgi:hypothetical protein